MSRPKRMKDPARLDLVIERKIKRDAFSLATKNRISISRLFELLVDAEKQRNGELAFREGTK